MLIKNFWILVFINGVSTVLFVFFIVQPLCDAAFESHETTQICPEENTSNTCHYIVHAQQLTCLGDYETRTNNHFVKILKVCRWVDRFINPEKILSDFPNIEKLIIEDGDVEDFLTDFPKSTELSVLVLTNLGLRTLRSSLLSEVTTLKVLNLTNNHINHVQYDLINIFRNLEGVFLSGNPWDCSTDLTWTLDNSILNTDNDISYMTCSHVLYPGKPVLPVMNLIKSMNDECPTAICKCSITNIVWDRTSTYLVPLITVDCSYRNLREMPDYLPHNTTTLLLQGNQITEVDPLVDNPVYRNIADIYLDNNFIKTVDILEGTFWLDNFRVFSLKTNLLTELPTYAFDHSFEKNRNLVQIYLGGNPWRCDCLFTPDFQHLLFKYEILVKDIDDIKCVNKEDDPNSMLQIIKLSRNAICTSPEHDINPLDVVSAIFAFLIVLVFGKLVYDYWNFKRTGKLPWIVTKMP